MTGETATGSDDVLTAEEVAAWLRVSSRTVQRAAEEGRIPCFWPAKRTVRFDRDELRAWMKSGGKVTAPRKAD